MDNKGFTLIETIIYIGLFGVIIGGGLVAAYQIIQAADGAYNHVVLQEEANFLLRKIDWAFMRDETSAQFTFALDGNNLTLKRNSGAAVILNSSRVAVSGWNFTKTTGIGGKPDSISAAFTLTTIQSGRPATQAFSVTKYLRQ